MMQWQWIWISWIDWVALVLGNVLMVVLAVSSFGEKERRAGFISLAGLVLNTGLWCGLIYFHHFQWVYRLNVGVILLSCVFLTISVIKWFPAVPVRETSQAEPFDERDHMFSRNAMQRRPGHMETYYAAHPDKKEVDAKIHAKPELGEPGAAYYSDRYSPVFDAAFHYLHDTMGASAGEPATRKTPVDQKEFGQIIKALGRYYGAVDIGFTPLKPYHTYSHAGRRPEQWGEAIRMNHKTAVVVIVAMDVMMMKGAPGLSAILESSRHYVEAAKIADIIGYYIRSFGYDARAHTDGNYQVLCVPMAVDAGLGELGRLGIFMHPVYGPCVRISVVTTELELTTAKPSLHRQSASIHHFCRICKKCADNCPTQSILKGEETESRGFRHWSVNQETCFSYWKSIGTDCGFCISVCPYTKPDTFIHKLVRFYISRNPINQRIALFMDDLFYGRRKSIPSKGVEPVFRHY